MQKIESKTIHTIRYILGSPSRTRQLKEKKNQEKVNENKKYIYYIH